MSVTINGVNEALKPYIDKHLTCNDARWAVYWAIKEKAQHDRIERATGVRPKIELFAFK